MIGNGRASVRLRLVGTVVALAVLTVGLAVLPPGERSAEAAPRAAETDSIDRLYRAYFLRAPEEPGFSYWSGQYLTCARTLAQIS